MRLFAQTALRNAKSIAKPFITKARTPDKMNQNQVIAWHTLGTPGQELRLEFTLPTGQSFRWRKIGPHTYVGVLGKRVLHMRQLDNEVEYTIIGRTPDALPEQDTAVLAEYFNLDTVKLADLTPMWCEADSRFAKVHPYLKGARMLRQDPIECLFQFLCSSNNHIKRIHGMVERLCAKYGTPIPVSTIPHLEEVTTSPLWFHAFPTLDQLSHATEEELREAGFGYRAKFVIGSVKELRDKEHGGESWLMALRDVSYEEAVESLCTLPGIGPKVAACVCLFSLDKHEAVPVDTHVWQLAQKYYAPQLRGKTNNPKIHGEVQKAFTAKFGPYAGWAHNTLFISELASMKEYLSSLDNESKGGAHDDDDDDDEEEEEEEEEEDSLEVVPHTPESAVGDDVVPRKRHKV